MSGIHYNLTIDSEIAPKFAEWQATRGGVIAWNNQEIGGGHPLQVFTPRITSQQIDIATLPETDVSKYVPNWRYGNPALVDFTSLRVECFTLVREYRAKLKRYYWGVGLAKASEAKAEKEASKIEGTYRWRNADEVGQLLAIVELGHMETITFAEWQQRQAATIT